MKHVFFERFSPLGASAHLWLSMISSKSEGAVGPDPTWNVKVIILLTKQRPLESSEEVSCIDLAAQASTLIRLVDLHMFSKKP